jgi:hypothetical protein
MRPRRPVGGVSAGLEAVTVVDTMVEEGGLGGKRCPCEPSVGEWDRRGEETRFGRRETDDGDGDGRARGEGAFAGREVAVGRVDWGEMGKSMTESPEVEKGSGEGKTTLVLGGGALEPLGE